jgi:predicted dehydrogenase
MVNVGLIGFGFAGRTFHAPIISAVEGMKLAAIVQRSGNEAAVQYPEAKVVRSVPELVALPDIQLIVVATPNQTHYPFAKECLLQDKDVVIDKPFATSSREARELVELAQSKKRLLSVYQNRRFDGDFMTVQQILREGKIGRVVAYESHFDRFRPELKANAWRERNEPGSGVLFDLGPHLIDQAIVLFGVPEGILADVRKERDGAVIDDAFDITFFYPQMRALMRATMLACIPGPRFMIHGTSGGFVKHGLDPQEDALKAGAVPGGTWGVEPKENWGTLCHATSSGTEGSLYPTVPGDYRKFYENIRDALESRAELVVTPEQALHVMTALELAMESSRTGQRVPWRA